MFKRREFSWDIARPSQVPVQQRPAWMTYDDEWIDELRRGLQACKVFTFMPIFFLAYNQMTNNLTSMASTMVLNGLPNDLLQNLNPLSIIILVPIIYGFCKAAKVDPVKFGLPDAERCWRPWSNSKSVWLPRGYLRRSASALCRAIPTWSES